MPVKRELPQRLRGAQPGNSNALKHGFYSRYFRPVDVTDLDSQLDLNLLDEITMLRVYIRRLLEHSDEILDIADAMDLLRVLSLASTSLTRLIRVQNQIHDPEAATLDFFMDAVEQAAIEMGFPGYEDAPGFGSNRNPELPRLEFDPVTNRYITPQADPAAPELSPGFQGGGESNLTQGFLPGSSDDESEPVYTPYS